MPKEIHDVLLPTPQHAEIIFVKRKKCIKKHFKITFLKHILKNNALGKNWISITVTLLINRQTLFKEGPILRILNEQPP